MVLPDDGRRASSMWAGDTCEPGAHGSHVHAARGVDGLGWVLRVRRVTGPAAAERAEPGASVGAVQARLDRRARAWIDQRRLVCQHRTGRDRTPRPRAAT